MGSQSCKCSEGNSPSGTLAGFMFKNFGLPTYAFLTKWVKQTKSSLELQWPLWEIFNLSKLPFLKTNLEDQGSKIKQNNWYIYFHWYLEASGYTQSSKISSLQENLSKLVELTKNLRENKMASEVSCSLPLSSLSQVPSCFSSQTPLFQTSPWQPSCAQAPPLTPSSSFPLCENLPPFKTISFEDSNAKPLITICKLTGANKQLEGKI